jgi:hypothetical protein
METHLYIKYLRQFEILSIMSLIAGFFAVTSAAATISGIVRNQTSGRPAASDEVILLRLDRSMQEEARTSTNLQGMFTLEPRYPDKLHLVRVVHQGVTYNQQASAGETLAIDVFDAKNQVQGITGNFELIRAGAKGNQLHVSDMIELRNESSPALTQAGEQTFGLYLPVNAKIDSVLAADPGKIGVMIPATPVAGEPGHYTVNFPLRPGTTKFAFNYDIPYAGQATFQIRSTYPFRQLAVMIPSTMTFVSQSSAFQLLQTGNRNYHVEAAQHVMRGMGPKFTISGLGVFPLLNAYSQSSPPPSDTVSATHANTVSGHSEAKDQGGSSLRAVATMGRTKRILDMTWWTIAIASLVVWICGLLLWRKRQQAVKSTPTTEVEQHGSSAESVLNDLKKKLFQLEIDHLNGAISPEEYAAAKQALNKTIERSLAPSGV